MFSEERPIGGYHTFYTTLLFYEKGNLIYLFFAGLGQSDI